MFAYLTINVFVMLRNIFNYWECTPSNDTHFYYLIQCIIIIMVKLYHPGLTGVLLLELSNNLRSVWFVWLCSASVCLYSWSPPDVSVSPGWGCSRVCRRSSPPDWRWGSSSCWSDTWGAPGPPSPAAPGPRWAYPAEEMISDHRRCHLTPKNPLDIIGITKSSGTYETTTESS